MAEAANVETCLTYILNDKYTTELGESLLAIYYLQLTTVEPRHFKMQRLQRSGSRANHNNKECILFFNQFSSEAKLSKQELYLTTIISGILSKAI